MAKDKTTVISPNTNLVNDDKVKNEKNLNKSENQHFGFYYNFQNINNLPPKKRFGATHDNSYIRFMKEPETNDNLWNQYQEPMNTSTEKEQKLHKPEARKARIL